MNEQPGTQEAAGQRVVHERCLCHEVIDHLRETLGVSPAVKQHLANSRIEFLKAIRGVIDDRIEKLSAKGQQGTKIAVE
jgi:hypothetical protein